MRRLTLAAVLAASFALTARAEDTRPPVITHTPVATAAPGEDVVITASIEDESEVFAPTLYFRAPGASSYTSAALARRDGVYTATVPAATDLEYWIEAYDEYGNGPAREGAPDRPHRIVLSGAGPAVSTTSGASGAVTTYAWEDEVDAQGRRIAQPVDAPGYVDVGYSTPIYKRWWAIGGAAVVVAAVTGVIVYAALPDTVERVTFDASFRLP